MHILTYKPILVKQIVCGAKMKLFRLALAQPFDEIEVVMDEKALFQMGRRGGGVEIRNQYA
jgi:hypothetical protein